jgi:HK97 gp10 family phage protein
VPSPRVPTARTLANRKARVAMNYKALDEMQQAMADGLLNLGLRIILDAEARAPRDPEAAARRGIPMMADTGGVQVWAGGKRVGGVWEKRPRGASVPKDQAVLLVGFGSPLAHLTEFGTIKQRAQPFLTPALMANVPDTGDYVKTAITKWAARGLRRGKTETVSARVVNALNAGTIGGSE